MIVTKISHFCFSALPCPDLVTLVDFQSIPGNAWHYLSLGIFGNARIARNPNLTSSSPSAGILRANRERGASWEGCKTRSASTVNLVPRAFSSFKMAVGETPGVFCHVTHDEMAFSEVVSSVWLPCLFSAIGNCCSNKTKTVYRVWVTKF